MQTLILRNRWALGDTVCMSALVRDIHRAYPGRYQIQLTGHYTGEGGFWKHNPYAKPAPDGASGRVIEMEYLSGIRAAGKGAKKHFLGYWHHAFEAATGIKVPCTEPKGDIHLSADEKKARVQGRYWLVVAGGKMDMTAKVWSTAYWQETVDRLAALGVKCVQAGAEFRNHFHPKLRGVEQYVGKTNSEREFFSLIYNAEGVICGITAAMHVAAVFDKPCVVIAGGREEPWWEAYTNAYYPDAFGPACAPVKVEHAYLHTLGLLDCGCGNLTKGCWRDLTVALSKADLKNQTSREKLCKKTAMVGPQVVPACLKMITPDHVIEAVMDQYEKGTLPPISPPKKTYALPTVDPRNALDLVPARYPLVDDKGQHAGWSNEWNRQLPKPVETSPNEPPEFAALDHPYVGGRFTLFVLGYGDHLDLITRCLSSIYDTCPTGRFELRVALNQPSARVARYVRGFLGRGLTEIYVNDGDRKKYPAMRQMFHDPEHPIDTPYLCWFDDDSWCRDKHWMVRLAEVIVANHPHQGRLYGAKYIHDLTPGRKLGGDPAAWFRAAPWWKNEPLFTAQGTRKAPNGSQIVFASGGFWALATHLIKDADIPDSRLNHNGGDCTIGCQVTQAGYKVVDFSPRPHKALIAWSDAPRRGFQEKFPWLSAPASG